MRRILLQPEMAIPVRKGGREGRSERAGTVKRKLASGTERTLRGGVRANGGKQLRHTVIIQLNFGRAFLCFGGREERGGAQLGQGEVGKLGNLPD